jgi:glyoxalase family protein
MTDKIAGNHHITLSTGDGQEDWDFHTLTLGLRPIKKTMLYDGAEPVYHLYYSNADMDAGAILTTFPMRQQGKMGRRGSNQVKEILFSVDEGSLDYWANRLDEKGIATEHAEELGTKRLKFAHPCGIPYTLVGTSGDERRGYGGGGVDAAHGIKGSYAPLISVIDTDEMVLYLETGIGAKKVAEDGPHQAWDLEGEKFGSRIELLHEPDVRPGTWHFAEGTPHHWAWNVTNEDNQMSLKGFIEGLGFTDVTEQKDRGYFLSIYNRTPGGALFEYAFTPADRGFLIDEPEDKLGTEVQIPPPFAHLADEMIAWLDPIEDHSR